MPPYYRCRDINFGACDRLPYNRTILQVHALEEITTNVGMLSNYVRGCHPDIDFYLCAVAIPECSSPEGHSPRPFCHAFCLEILEGCEDAMTQIGISINCSVSSQDHHVTNKCIQPNNSTTALYSSRCNDNEFMCGNGRCVLMADVCNHNNDCGDSSDETNCYYPSCHRIELDVCNVLPYNSTILPASSVKGLDQTFTFVFKFAGNCNQHFKFVICAMTLPECPAAESLVSRPVCRPLCKEVLEDCGYILEQLHIQINCSMTPKVPDNQGCIEPDDISHDIDSMCQPITVEACNILPYNQTLFIPNNVTANVTEYIESVRGCHEHVDLFLCVLAFPECPVSGVMPRPVCPSLCEEIRASCAGTLPAIGVNDSCGISQRGTDVNEDRCIG
ncbi:uncharacterized protein LOC144360725 [Saccoglossus kowalevskii]